MKYTAWMLFAAGMAFALPASAATWSISGTVTKVAISENPNNGGSGRLLEVDFATAGNLCGSSTTHAAIASTESTALFDHWIRQAQSAYLSGRKLNIVTSNATGSCKTWYVELL